MVAEDAIEAVQDYTVHRSAIPEGGGSKGGIRDLGYFAWADRLVVTKNRLLVLLFP
jgi:hypothetical protein